VAFSECMNFNKFIRCFHKSDRIHQSHSYLNSVTRLACSVSKGRDVPLSLCPGTKTFPLSRCPSVPGQGQEQMSRDKLLCPGTSRDKIIFPNGHKKQKKRRSKTGKRCSTIGKGRSKTGKDILKQPVSSHGKILSLSCCPFVPGQKRNFCPDVPKSCAVPSRWKRYLHVPSFCLND
jgi:hypothetical protein